MSSLDEFVVPSDAEVAKYAPDAMGGASDFDIARWSVVDEAVEDGFGRLLLKDRRRYARANAVMEAGVWAAPEPRLLYSIMMGSIPDVRNDYRDLKQDNREVRRSFAKMGLAYEDCGFAELSPESHEFRKRDGTIGRTVGKLWHLHTIWRFSEFIKASDVRSFLAPFWGKVHGSEIVNVSYGEDYDHFIKYAVKESIKSYCREGSAGRRLLMSDNWLPSGYRKVVRELTNWALFHGAKWRSEDDISQFAGGSFIAYAWEIMHDFLRRWCAGEVILLDYDDHIVSIDGDEISGQKSGRWQYAYLRRGGDDGV